jgi:hypothetical protein
MRKGLLGAMCIVVAFSLAACGSSGGKSAESPTSTTNPFENASWEKAGPTPSISAKMICSTEARDDIAASLGVKATQVTEPTWNAATHEYSCDYVYPRGKVRLTVKEMSSADETTAEFERIKQQYGTVQKLNGLGQGAWVLRNGNVVVRKDYKTLLVDVTDVPPDMVPAMRRSDVAINIAAVIMSCWTGA